MMLCSLSRFPFNHTFDSDNVLPVSPVSWTFIQKEYNSAYTKTMII